jgi:hypothetical protein
MSMRLKREGDWIQYRTEGGKTFYYNEKTCSFQWEDPFTTNDAKSKISVHPSSSDDHDDRRIKKETAPFRPQIKEQQTSWTPYVDESTGHTFWYNHATKVSQWENPFENVSSSGAVDGKVKNKKDDFDAFPVFHDDDLGL